jgi:ribonuclease HI
VGKEFFLKQLKSIHKILGKDSDVQKALKLLEKKIEETVDSDWKTLVGEVSKKNQFGHEDFELPVELSASNPLNLTRFAVFSDGACRGNPGPGAWANVCQDHTGKVIFESCGVDMPTTNNKMELEGVIQGLIQVNEYVKQNNINNSLEIHVYTDSKYVIEGIEKWVVGWKARGWKKADNKAPENLDFWMRLDQLVEENRPICHWIKGHQGHPQNEFCDQLANKALDDSGF